MELQLIKNLINPNDKIAVALSGGEDSMALFYALLELKNDVDFTLKAINVEHGIRGEQSKQDSAFCVKQANRFGIEIKTVSVDAPSFAKNNGYSLEQAARILRYQVFKELLDVGFADKIATAHHKNDNFETVLFNVFRGSGACGVGGIKQQNGRIIRPLLNVSKQEIRQYVENRQIPFVQDQSNFDLEFSRNYLRSEIIPRIIERFPSALSSTLRMSEAIAKDDELLFELAKDYVKIENNLAHILYCEKYPLFARASILAMKYSGITKDYSSTHLKALFDLQSLPTGKQLNLIGGVVAVKEYDKITLRTESNPSPQHETKWNNENQVYNGYEIKVEKISIEKYKKTEKPCYKPTCDAFITIFADEDKLQNCVLRVPKQGDVFKKIGGGSKSLKKHLVDLKISKFERANLPILACDSEVTIIFGIGTSKISAVDNNTKNVVALTISKLS